MKETRAERLLKDWTKRSEEMEDKYFKLMQQEKKENIKHIYETNYQYYKGQGIAYSQSLTLLELMKEELCQ